MKAMIRWVAVCCLAGFASAASAERLEVFRWQANSSSPEGLVQGMMAAAKIHEKYGATVGVFRMDVGSAGYPTFDYVLRWDSGEAWAKTKETNSNEEWQAFWAQASQSPTGTLLWSMEALNWDDGVSAADFAEDGPYRVYVWQPGAGKAAAVYAAFTQAAKMHTAMGAKVNIYQEGVGGNGKVHYVMSFDDWAAMADFGDRISASEEFRFLQAASAGSATPIGSIQGEPLYYTGR
ncbi:MAG: hypothetical protein P8J31_00090 [Luminiphilus sp.]|jgi:hypothetical protein|nr:hypothetical protein [Luminiphilus sp.]RZO81916.1 MAG: hypothetical protein EVA63_00400 [Halieaceae bacterium]|tara:strand:+ start:15615 stop:16319 length:705 start_codon:yes stop_codon:yes gene_type:complete